MQNSYSPQQQLWHTPRHEPTEHDMMTTLRWNPESRGIVSVIPVILNDTEKWMGHSKKIPRKEGTPQGDSRGWAKLFRHQDDCSQQPGPFSVSSRNDFWENTTWIFSGGPCHGTVLTSGKLLLRMQGGFQIDPIGGSAYPGWQFLPALLWSRKAVIW